MRSPFSLQAILFFYFLTVVLQSCLHENNTKGNEVNLATLKKDTIVFIGSDLTIAEGLRPESGFVSLFERSCQNQNLSIKVVNAGIKDETFLQIQERLPLILKNNLKWLILEVPHFLANEEINSFIQIICKQHLEIRIILLFSQKNKKIKNNTINILNFCKNTPRILEFSTSTALSLEAYHKKIASEVLKTVKNEL